MKNKIVNSALFLLALGGIFVALAAFKNVLQRPSKMIYMQVCTVESIIPAGIGRSKMITVLPDGTKTEEDLQNFYSMVGINFGNISNNNIAITKKINDLTAQGWEFDKVITGTQSPAENNSQGIFISRYFFKKSFE
jgi:hypothetical protein